VTRRRSPRSTSYPRTARLDRLIGQIVAEELERIDDPRLYLATVTGVSSDPEAVHATVWFGTLSHEARMALTELRPRLQAAVARQTHLKNTPTLTFGADPAIESGGRVEQILKELRDRGEFDPRDEADVASDDQPDVADDEDDDDEDDEDDDDEDDDDEDEDDAEDDDEDDAEDDDDEDDDVVSSRTS
jgi:ribosome-binding factor A